MTTDLKVGCQTFTWEMLGKGWTGRSAFGDFHSRLFRH
jgi:hypothetical protein